MALRFRRSIKIAPGIRLNAGKQGFSVSVGGRGATVTMGKRGVYGNVGIPGTGLSVRERIDGGGRRRKKRAPAPTKKISIDARLSIASDGNIRFETPDGRALDPDIEQLLRKEQAGKLKEYLASVADSRNKILSRLEQIHHQTPPPDTIPYEPREFDEPRPEFPKPLQAGLLGFIIPGRRRKIDRKNKERYRDYQKRIGEWEATKKKFDDEELAHRRLCDAAAAGDEEAMAELFSAKLSKLDWPRETIVSFNFADNGTTIYLDVDLPEIEHMPDFETGVSVRNLCLVEKKLSESRKRKLYMTHIHGIGMRLVGEAFATLPKIETVVISGYSQRPSRADGNIADEYLYSVRIPRDEWSELRLEVVEDIDPVEALGQFEIRRKMTKTGIFTPIEPFL